MCRKVIEGNHGTLHFNRGRDILATRFGSKRGHTVREQAAVETVSGEGFTRNMHRKFPSFVQVQGSNDLISL